MYQYNNLLVPLNLTTMDDATINYASRICRMSKSETAHFLHVKRPSEVPIEILEEYPQLLNPGIEQRKKTMQERVSTKFKGSTETEISFDVIEGKPFETILDQILQKDIDLVIVGRKTEAKESRRLPINLARKAPCSVLIIPEKSENTISNILVSIDFSDFCVDAFEQSINLAEVNKIQMIHCLHVFQLPLGHYKTGKTHEEFTEIMMKNVMENYEYFISKIDLKGIEVKPIFMLHEKPVQAIQSVVEKNNIDMLVMGTRGRNAGAGILLGSVTEDVILNTKIPLMAVKKKGTGLSFLEVLLKYV
jgi:nucleotide-binding universal stress UspA family protein